MKASFKYWHIIFLLPLALLASGCEQKGCTDKSALNYNSLANKEDGSCLYCEHEHLDKGGYDINIVDDNYYSDYYNELVARVHITQVSDSYNYSTCGVNECKIYYEVENLINKRMSFYYSLYGSGEIFFNISEYADIQAFQTSSRDSSIASSSSSSFCGTLSPSQIYFNVQGGNIYYY